MGIIFVSKNFEKNKDFKDLFQVPYPEKKDELFLMVDLDRCIGCGACGVACEIEHGKMDALGKPRLIKAKARGVDTEPHSICLPLTCRNCPEPCEYYDSYNFWITCPNEESLKERGLMECDLCEERTKKGLWPACATRCSLKTIYFGTLSELTKFLRERRLREVGDVFLE
jgi:formate dehydrogenase iron-sulfur subunit